MNIDAVIIDDEHTLE